MLHSALHLNSTIFFAVQALIFAMALSFAPPGTAPLERPPPPRHCASPGGATSASRPHRADAPVLLAASVAAVARRSARRARRAALVAGEVPQVRRRPQESRAAVVGRQMKLAYWMYMGPAHIGTLRVASSFKNVHAIMHAPLGDDYFNVMRSMLERKRDFTPVTASVVDRHVLSRGSENKVVDNITRKDQAGSERGPDGWDRMGFLERLDPKP